MSRKGVEMLVAAMVILLPGCAVRRGMIGHDSLHKDSVAQMVTGRSLTEEVDRVVRMEWWGIPSELPRILSDTCGAMGLHADPHSGRGGVMVQVREQRRIHDRAERMSDVRMEQSHTEVAPAPSSTPRRLWLMVSVGIMSAAWGGLMLYGLVRARLGMPWWRDREQ